MLWGGNVWGSRSGVQAKRPDPTKKAYALRGHPQAAFSWRWNSKQQSRRRYAANGFALLPQCRFLGRQRWVVEPAVKPVGCLHTFVPVLPLRRGRHQSDRRRIALACFHSSAIVTAPALRRDEGRRAWTYAKARQVGTTKEIMQAASSPSTSIWMSTPPVLPY